MLSLNDPVSRLHLVGPANAQALNHLGVKTVSDLLFYFPRDWQDLSEIRPISALRPNEPITIKAKIKKFSQFRSPRRRLSITQALLEDETGNVVATWWGQPFLKNSLSEGREYYFSGKGQIHNTLQLQNPAFELVKPDTIHTAGLVPLYDLTEGITAKQMRYWIKQCLSALTDMADFIPRTIQTRLKLLDLQSAIKNIHFPQNAARLEAARKRLAFDELFVFQLALQSFKKKIAALPAPKFAFDQTLIKKFVASLPFALTASQRLSAWEILRDLQNPHPMNRLLEGEVGSGKTVVAGIAILEVAVASWQSVLLAPTEILAWQHYETLKKLFRDTNISLAILTRSQKLAHNSPRPSLTLRAGAAPPLRVKGGGEELLNDIASGKIRIIIGTHALLQEHIKFQKIGLLVVDEQHRFGVEQRAKLLAAGQHGLVPHLLSMTATPIPRTLALAFYGDLDISMLRELPSGRKKIITRLVAPENRGPAYEFIRKELQNGRQTYVVVPLVGENSPNPLFDQRGGEGGVQNTKSVIAEAERLKQIFPEFHIGLLHGRMKGEEKKQIMDAFHTRQIQMLVSTTVIEVGVDQPNATIMLIENAERFGLAQLHQLRGRVGRGPHQSYCLLFAESFSEITKARLEAVVASNDGFELAETDLRLRGPGEIMGSRQAGYIPLRVARLSDRALIKLAKEEAEKLLEEDSLERYPVLKAKAAAIARDAHLQ